MPVDEQIHRLSLNGNSLWELKDNAKGIAALRKLSEDIIYGAKD
jgi:hypothetical protein